MNVSRLALAALLCGTSVAAPAATITGWNLNNVAVTPGPDPLFGESIIYDRDITGPNGSNGAQTNGKILWQEAADPLVPPSPGMTVLNDAPDLNNQTIENCILTVGPTCEGPFRSGKRIKQVASKMGATDLVFDTLADADSNSYQLFHRIINATPQRLGSFSIELGFGVGDNFIASGANDGLSFDLSLGLGPNNEPAFTQYSFGLFGDENDNPNVNINGFFDTARAGWNLDINEDAIYSLSQFGAYEGLFGPGMLNNAQVPDGYYFDTDGDPSTDAVLMAWFNGSVWEQRRIVDANDSDGVVSVAAFETTEEALIGEGWSRLAIDDLRNLNVNLGILTGPNFNGDNFTLRFVTNAVPEPGTWAMLIAGFGLVGASMRRRRQATVIA